MSNEIDGIIIHCCDCGRNSILDDIASDLTTLAKGEKLRDDNM